MIAARAVQMLTANATNATKAVTPAKRSAAEEEIRPWFEQVHRQPREGEVSVLCGRATPFGSLNGSGYRELAQHLAEFSWGGFPGTMPRGREFGKSFPLVRNCCSKNRFRTRGRWPPYP